MLLIIKERKYGMKTIKNINVYIYFLIKFEF